jgi:FkbM family methyltransferase
MLDSAWKIRRWLKDCPTRVRRSIRLRKSTHPGTTILRDRDHEYKFAYCSAEEKRRADRLFTKEPGTIAWLYRTLKRGDVFFDIGANIGVYTIFAGYRVGDSGSVYGFEPHLPNAASLLNNIEINSLRSRVQVIAIPLSDQDAFEEFQYFSLNPSRSHSQLRRSALRGQPFHPVATELKYGCRLDSLLAMGFLPPPNIIKIDVDGHECEIIAGMKDLLHSPAQPRSVQIEIGAETYDYVTAHMAHAGYEMVDRHWTEAGRLRFEANPTEELPYNAIFESSRPDRSAKP